MSRPGIEGVRKWALAISIAIVFNLFVNYGIATFYKEPKMESFCNYSNERSYAVPMKIAPPVQQQPCQNTYIDDNFTRDCSSKRGYVQYSYNSSGCPEKVYCETCHVPYEDAKSNYDGNIFLFLLIIGVAAVIVGLSIGVESVGYGFLIGGIISIIIGTVRNWSNLTEVLRFVVLGILLAILIFIGLKKV